MNSLRFGFWAVTEPRQDGHYVLQDPSRSRLFGRRVDEELAPARDPLTALLFQAHLPVRVRLDRLRTSTQTLSKFSSPRILQISLRVLPIHPFGCIEVHTFDGFPKR